MRFRNRWHGNQKLKHRDGPIALIDVCEGECAVISHTAGGFGVIRRLAEMGLTPGVEVKVLRKCNFHGPVEIMVRDVTLALGYGVASKVFVHLLKAKMDG